MELNYFNYGRLRGREEFEHVCAQCGKDPAESPLVEKAKLAKSVTEGKVALPLCTECFESGTKPVLVGRSDKVTEELGRKAKKAEAKEQKAGEAKRRKEEAEAAPAPPKKAAKGKAKAPAAKQPPAKLKPPPPADKKTFFKPSAASGVSGASSSAAPSSAAPAAGAARAAPPPAAGGDDDEWWEFQSAAEHAATVGQTRKPRNPASLRLSPREKRLKTGLEALAELSLERQRTIGHNFNCLAFSVMIGSEQIGYAVEAQRAVCEQSIEERRLTHEEVMSRLPPEAATTLGPNGGWWAGQSCATLTAIFEESRFMNEAHIHGFANRLQRTIVTVDRQISMREAVELRTSSEQPIWVLLEPDHFSALLPSA